MWIAKFIVALWAYTMLSTGFFKYENKIVPPSRMNFSPIHMSDETALYTLIAYLIIFAGTFILLVAIVHFEQKNSTEANLPIFTVPYLLIALYFEYYTFIIHTLQIMLASEVLILLWYLFLKPKET